MQDDLKKLVWEDILVSSFNFTNFRDYVEL